VSAALTDLRKAIADQLQNTLGIEFVPGKLEGHQARDLGCTFPVGRTEVGEGELPELLTVKVRIYQRYVAVRSPEQPADPAPLEELAVRLLTALDDIQVGAGGVWFFRVPEVEIDMDDQGVEATVVAVAANAFVGGG
jgi:hypothetical protein